MLTACARRDHTVRSTLCCMLPSWPLQGFGYGLKHWATPLAQVAELKQRLVRAKKQVMALKKQAADAADERDAALTELAALRSAASAPSLPFAASCWLSCRPASVRHRAGLQPSTKAAQRRP